MSPRESVNSLVILGAGPAGMAAAMTLHRAGRRFVLVEKAAQVGGLAKTYQFGDFRTDNGPHRFFSKNRFLYDFIEGLIGEHWISVDRFTRFYIGGCFFRYPIEFKDTLSKLGWRTAARAVYDYFVLQKLRPFKRPPRNFEEYALSQFGRTLAEFNILNYTEKIWGVPCRDLSWEWGEQRIQGLSVASLLKKMLLSRGGPKTLVDRFYYPDLGTGLIYEEIKRRIESDNRVLLGTEPTEIEHADGRVRRIGLSSGDEFRDPAHVISSIPITKLVGLLRPAPPDNVLRAAASLRFRSQVYLFVTLAKPRVSRDQWIYFPDPEVPFGRISEMKNFSAKMSPQDKTSLFIEFFCWEGDAVWRSSKEELTKIALEWLERLGFVRASEGIDVRHLRQSNVYPTYDLGYKQRLGVVERYFDSFSNLLTIGRPGRFRYTNQDHSLEMGILAARGVLEGRRPDLSEIGMEREYFEKGEVEQNS